LGSTLTAPSSPYAFAFGLTLDPAGNVYVSDNPDVLAPPNNVAHVWKVNVGTTGPAQPALTSKPGNPTNNASPDMTEVGEITPCSSTPEGQHFRANPSVIFADSVELRFADRKVVA